ncbi:MAG: regulatory protein RecX [Lachnospiraceae bacterium]|nr:regulatory protein RecX [Lachnospiraceae bacterium]
MFITKLQALGKGRYEVMTDSGIVFVLYKGDLARYDVHEGEEVTSEKLEEIYSDTLYKRAVNRTLYLLGQKDYTLHELEEKLENGKYPESVIRAALETVQDYGYVDDERYTRRYVECYLERKSGDKIRRELMQKGISRDMIGRVLQEVREQAGDEEGRIERRQIRQLLEKRHFDKTADRKERDRHFAFLMRRGYSATDITAVFREWG